MSLVYIVCTPRAKGSLPEMTDGDIVGRRFYESYELADKARITAEHEARYSGFDTQYEVYSVDCVVQQKVTFEALF